MKRVLTLLAGLLLGLAAGVLILLGFRESQPPPADPQSGSSSQLVMGGAAPDFSLETPAGELVSLADFKDRVVLLNFWATWCAPCRLEMPDLQARADQYPDELVVVAVNYDEEPAEVQAFIEALELDFTVVLDPGGTVNQLYRVRGYPSSYLVDRQGIVQIQHIGLLTGTQLDEYLAQLGLENGSVP